MGVPAFVLLAAPRPKVIRLGALFLVLGRIMSSRAIGAPTVTGDYDPVDQFIGRP